MLLFYVAFYHLISLKICFFICGEMNAFDDEVLLVWDKKKF